MYWKKRWSGWPSGDPDSFKGFSLSQFCFHFSFTFHDLVCGRHFVVYVDGQTILFLLYTWRLWTTDLTLDFTPAVWSAEHFQREHLNRGTLESCMDATSRRHWMVTLCRCFACIVRWFMPICNLTVRPDQHKNYEVVHSLCIYTCRPAQILLHNEQHFGAFSRSDVSVTVEQGKSEKKTWFQSLVMLTIHFPGLCLPWSEAEDISGQTGMRTHHFNWHVCFHFQFLDGSVNIAALERFACIWVEIKAQLNKFRIIEHLKMEHWHCWQSWHMVPFPWSGTDVTLVYPGK